MVAYDLSLEAESDLLSLRPAPSLGRASTASLRVSPPAPLHVERAIYMVNSFHFTRLVRLRLTHQDGQD
ncbi:MAG: hypothetical protein AAB654_06760, partial [Acidobacteriota bacterium]